MLAHLLAASAASEVVAPLGFSIARVSSISELFICLYREELWELCESSI
eukprot:COSAG02_NODE_13429_length_1396_cov_1.753277_2_plen_49_part_00